MFATLARCGLRIEADSRALAVTTPADFHRAYPATGGAIYGRASHGWMASFQRAAARSRIAGLYFAGGSCHPGAGLPMAALSGSLAAQALQSRLGFAKTVPSGGYAWWYVDGLSDDGHYGITLIAFIGSVFSPYYAWSGRRSPDNHCALNVALYGRQRPPLGDDGTRPQGGDAGYGQLRHRPQFDGMGRHRAHLPDR